ncbi:coenzyme F420-0:L-glutamate ligase [Gammaproteobacteria bacterium]|jgi:coenzyme F420-0:L-glutamate ligase/coenzyme F420-1:gamma-L-glutamate ligase|nr:coenzyme F420-0:L-glutamate ligase [Pseudomonadota bacterium]MDA8815980.1 coenzyme F420-0:L-glutamate ligase [Gammaproteobacteria bacterium]MDA1083200.1 coenzyme F420-0:L-glutamate ligase [Pseudomonadota bacterium]MDA9765733.1 coenzyme F420-0:L-glutamate ligase [Gammaproteobacteria bacterium]MDA9805310.1 coenzyme F420-0:L-glutamate ligase [Gammaproteobacteria bacterium]
MDNLLIQALKEFPLIQPGDNLSSIILESCKHNKFILEDDDIIVIAQKVVSKSENRYKNLLEIKPSKQATNLALSLNRDPAFIQLILNESNEIISTDKNVIIVEHKLGFININAGIDRSNIPENKNLVLLLPEDPSSSSQKIYEDISSKIKKNISVIITDSMTRPYRSGVMNFALASTNIQSLIDLKGEKDIYGNILQATEIAIADELAAASGLLMGQGNDGMPIVIIRGFDRKHYLKNDAFNLIVKKEDDLYR